MSEQMEEKIKAYRTAPFDARFPNTNQTRNCFQNYLGKPARPHLHGACQPELGWAYSRRRRANECLYCWEQPGFLLFTADFHRCSKALSAKGQDPAPCVWYQRVYKSLCPISWVSFSITPDVYPQISTFLDSFFSSSCLLQVQKWDEQLEAGTFPGKIWTALKICETVKLFSGNKTESDLL